MLYKTRSMPKATILHNFENIPLAGYKTFNFLESPALFSLACINMLIVDDFIYLHLLP